jgi:excisionase family DNA binding protein
MNPIRELPDTERFLTKKDVAKRLGIRPRTVSVWVQQGRLPVYRVGRYLRFKWNEVEEHLAATCRTPGEGRPS